MNDRDIKIDTFGTCTTEGTNFAVKLTHIPTGLVVRESSQRSLVANNRLAVERLEVLVEAFEVEGSK